MSNWTIRTMVMLCVLSMVACAGLKAEPEAPPRDRWQAGIDANTAVIATASIDVRTPDGHYPVRAAIIFKKPAFLRLELLPLIGTPDFLMTMSPEAGIRAFIPSRGEFFTARADTDQLKQFLPWALPAADLIGILTASAADFADGDVTRLHDREASVWRASVRTSSGEVHVAWIDDAGRLVQIIAYDRQGRELYRAAYADYRSNSPLARRVSIQAADGYSGIDIRYASIGYDMNLGREVFYLALPPGARIIGLDD